MPSALQSGIHNDQMQQLPKLLQKVFQNFLSLNKSFIKKLFQNFLLFLEELFEEIELQNTTLYLFKPTQAIFQREYLQNDIYKRKYAS
jgi:hypothetical protein